MLGINGLKLIVVNLLLQIDCRNLIAGNFLLETDCWKLITENGLMAIYMGNTILFHQDLASLNLFMIEINNNLSLFSVASLDLHAVQFTL